MKACALVESKCINFIGKGKGVYQGSGTNDSTVYCSKTRNKIDLPLAYKQT
jgi:hypothetical protein